MTARSLPVDSAAISARSHALRTLAHADPISSPDDTPTDFIDPAVVIEQAFASGMVPARARPPVQNLVLTTGRHLVLLDGLLDSFLVRGGMQTLPVTVRSGMRLGASDTLFGDAPVLVCVSSWVEDIKLLAGQKVAGVANAVLR